MSKGRAQGYTDYYKNRARKSPIIDDDEENEEDPRKSILPVTGAKTGGRRSIQPVKGKSGQEARLAAIRRRLSSRKAGK